MSDITKQYEIREKLTKLLQKLNPKIVELEILLDSKQFIELSGSILEKEMIMLNQNNNICLRPEFTVPLVKEYINQIDSLPIALIYAGPIFRKKQQKFIEKIQVGVEAFLPEINENLINDNSQNNNFESEIIAAIYQIINQYLPNINKNIIVNNINIFINLLNALNIETNNKNKLIALFRQKTNLKKIFQTNNQKNQINLQNQQKIVDNFSQIIKNSGKIIGNRKIEEIAERLMIKNNEKIIDEIDDKNKEIIIEYLNINDEPNNAIQKIKNIFDKINAKQNIENIESFFQSLNQKNINSQNIIFNTEFGRGMNYYEGWIFEINKNTIPNEQYLAAGGGYNNLIQKFKPNIKTKTFGAVIELEKLI